MTRGPCPCIGLRIAQRVSGEPYLRGIVAEEFTVPKGAQVQLRRLRPDGAEGATHAIVFLPPDPRTTRGELEEAVRDANWHRRDPRDEQGEGAPW